jgi:hypothetical protein
MSTVLIVDWEAMSAKHGIRCCHHWVTDESIRESLSRCMFDDLRRPHTGSTHRANRIANIISMMQIGVEFKPLLIKVTRHGVRLSDGNHRLRALEFLGKCKRVPIKVRGDYKILKEFVVSK